MLENSSLRDSLCNMEKELVTLLNYKYFTSLSSPARSNISKVRIKLNLKTLFLYFCLHVGGRSRAKSREGGAT